MQTGTNWYKLLTNWYKLLVGKSRQKDLRKGASCVYILYITHHWFFENGNALVSKLPIYTPKIFFICSSSKTRDLCVNEKNSRNYVKLKVIKNYKLNKSNSFSTLTKTIIKIIFKCHLNKNCGLQIIWEP